jgi:drug/metabolite transporter (DMT)-like permease
VLRAKWPQGRDWLWVAALGALFFSVFFVIYNLAMSFGGAAAFYLWVFALERTTPTRVANTMTVNPIAASTVAALLVGGLARNIVL